MSTPSHLATTRSVALLPSGTPARRARTLLLACATALVPSLACGGEPASAAATGARDPSAGTGAAASLSNARPVSGSGQLLGTWMRVTPGDFAGLEFVQPDRVMMTLLDDDRPARTVTASFQVLADGRLSLVGALGMTEVFRTRLGGDALELTSETSRDPAQSFTRLPAGQTLAEGLRAQQERLEAERARRQQAFRAQLASGELVLEATGDAAPRWRLSLDQDPAQRDVSGTLLLQDAPVGAGDPPSVRSFRFTARFEAVDELSNASRATLVATPSVPPRFEAPVSGEVGLILDGPLERPTAAGTAHFPALAQSPVALVARQDAGAHAELVRLFEQRTQYEAGRLAELEDVLGAELELQGKRIIAGRNWRANTASARLRLAGDGRPGYTTLVGLASEVDLPAEAELAMHAGGAALFITLPSGEQWRLQPDGESMRGTWRPDARAEFGGHGDEELQLELQVVRRTGREEAAALGDAVDRFWNVDLLQGMHFTGRLETLGSPFRHASLELQGAEDGSRTATLWIAAQRGGGVLVLDGAPALVGTPGRDEAALTTASWMDAGAAWAVPAPRSGLLRLYEPLPTLELSLVLEDGSTLTGFFSPTDAEACRAAEEALLASLRDTTFGVVMARQALPASLRFGSLEDPARIEAEVLGEAPGLFSQGASPGVFRGEIVGDHFLPVLRGTVHPEPGSDRPAIEVELVQTFPNPKMGLSGWTVGGGEQPEPSWFGLSPAR